MTVQRLETFEVVLAVEPLVEDAPAVPASKNFALQSLVESHWALSHGHIFSPQPSPESELVGLAESSTSVNEMREWFSMMHPHRVEITEGEYEKLQMGVEEEGVRSWGMEAGLFFKEYPPRFDDFCAIAQTVIGDTQIETREDHTVLTIQLVSPSVIEHLTEGVNWESAVRDMRA